MRGLSTREYFALFALVLLHNECWAAPEINAEKGIARHPLLPKAAMPISYEIKLVPEIVEGNLTHHGEVKIGVNVLEKTSNLTLNSQDLRIDESFTRVVDANGVVHKPKSHTHVKDNWLLVIEFNQLIDVGLYTLNLKFASNTTNSSGVSTTSWVNDHGEKVWTIFSGVTARRRAIFPCWDEFDLRATYNLSIKHSANYRAVSNMPIRHSYRDENGKQWTNFDVTPSLPLYLMAFVVSNFDCIQDESEMINVCGANDVLPRLKYASDISERTIVYLEKHMNIKNNFSKIDLFAVPYKRNKDVSPAWGLILYRESSITYEPFKEPVNVKADRALVVVSGLLQQLIRNVMPYREESFTYASIISGLSTYLNYYIVDKLYPDWREVDRLRVRASTNLASTVYDSDDYMPLEWQSYEEAPCHKFRAGSNDWGAVVFRMLSNIVSEDVFKAGIAKFINDNQYVPITSDHLWDAIQSVYDIKTTSSDNLSIKQVMKSWTEQRGYPLLNVTRDYKTGKVVITQRSSIVNDTSSRWWVPISFATKSNPNFANTTPTHWLRPEDERLIIDGVDGDDWIIVNIQLTGFYRVNYDKCNWKKIIKYMNSEDYTKIHYLNRAQLLSDLYYMIRLNQQNITTFFELAKYLSREDDYIPWSQAMDIVSTLRNAIFDDGTDAAIANFFVKLMDKLIEKFGFEDRSGYEWVKKYKPFYDSLDNRTKKFVPVEKALEKFYKDGYRNEDFSTKGYRKEVLLFACALGHPKCLDSAKSQLCANIKNATETPISANLEGWVKCSGAAGNEDHLLKMVTSSMDTSYLRYLSCSPDKTVLWKYVEGVLTGQLKAGECQLFSALRGLIKTAYVPRNYTHLSRMVVYFIKNFDRVYNFYLKRSVGHHTNATRYTATLFKDYIYHIPTLDQLKQANDMVRNFTSNLPFVIDDYINQQTKRIEWSDKTSLIINEWMASNTSPEPATA